MGKKSPASKAVLVAVLKPGLTSLICQLGALCRPVSTHFRIKGHKLQRFDTYLGGAKVDKALKSLLSTAAPYSYSYSFLSLWSVCVCVCKLYVCSPLDQNWDN